MLLSIVIPTKNRYQTLFNVVDTILGFGLNHSLEIVIQDNSDDNSEALKFVEERNHFSNLKYFYEDGNLSVIENSDKAVLNATGEYVCFIGDDDGVMPNIVQVTEWMKANNFEALKSFKPNYYWPDQKANYLSSDTSGNLKIRKFSYRVKKIATQRALDECLKHGGTSIKLLPCLYHGIVKKETLNRIFQRCNSYFPAPSPDMANAIALTQVMDEYVYVDFPVAISGKSSKSTGGQGVLHKHINKIEDVAHLPKDTGQKWSKKIPKYWTGPTIWAESVLKALESFNNDRSKEFNFEYLYAYLYVHNSKRNSNKIFDNFSYQVPTPKFLFFYLKIFLDRTRIFINNRLNKNTITKNNLKSIKNAVEEISKVMDTARVELILNNDPS